MGHSIGIDLGTTNSVCAYTKDGTNPKVFASAEKQNLTPSVVALHRDGRLLIGTTAVRMAKSNPECVIFSVKRLMGRRYDDEEVSKVQRHVSYRIVPAPDGSGMAHVMIGEKSYSPIEVSALILEKIKRDAEAALGEPVTHAVITVPAYFDDNQREATRQAGGRAGLKVKRVIDEPTAAAYAFGMDMDASQSKAIVVYDLGGGTFDISVIFVGAGVPTVEAVGGDIWLGGDRFDNAIIDFVLRRYPEYSDELRKDPAFMLQVKTDAEQAKKDLAGGAPSTDIAITSALRGKVDVEVTLRREDFEEMILEDIRESVRLVGEVLAEKGMTTADIDNVLLVGGSTGLPTVRRLLEQKFGAEKIRATVNPMECVALGAAILASRSEKKICPRRKCNTENEPDAAVCVNPGCKAPLDDVEAQVRCPHCSELHAKHEVTCPQTGKSLVAGVGGVTPKPIGVGVEGDAFEIVVPRGTRYPTTETIFREFKTSVDSQDWIIFPVYQGFDNKASSNERQGEIVIPESGAIPEEKRVPKGTPLDVGFEINEDGVLTVQVKGKGALSWLKVGKVVRPYEEQPHPVVSGGDKTIAPEVACGNCGKMTSRSKAVCEHCGAAMHGSGASDGQPPQQEWKGELLFWMKFANVAAREYDWVVAPAVVKTLTDLLAQADRIMQTNDEAGGRLLVPKLENAVTQTCGGIFDLIQASVVRNAGLGQLDQQQKLSSMLDEFKRRALQQENPQSAVMQELRSNIGELTKSIFGGLSDRGKVPCQKCAKLIPKPTKANPLCGFCGFNHFGITR